MSTANFPNAPWDFHLHSAGMGTNQNNGARPWPTAWLRSASTVPNSRADVRLRWAAPVQVRIKPAR